MSVWDEVVGQSQTVAILSDAATRPAALSHAWLVTGPPGSGRSVAARAFAAALQCPNGGCGHCQECRTARQGTHCDVDVVATEALSIGVKEARELIQLAARAPSVGAYRVVIVEDADRLTEQSANALLKALEEPTARTIWVLCAPSPHDVLITIRSRLRQVRLRTPPVSAVADLLQRRDGIDAPMAVYAARAAQSHVGMARRLALDEGARIRRHDTIALTTQIGSVSDAVGAAADILSIAEQEREKTQPVRAQEERANLLVTLGGDPQARTQPPAIRVQLNALEKEQKTRATRFTRDVVDRALVDMLSVYRDILMLRVRAEVGLVNEDARVILEQLAARHDDCSALRAMEAIMTARTRIAANVAPQLALEAMCLSLRVPIPSVA